jgi:hypothetical protein
MIDKIGKAEPVRRKHKRVEKNRKQEKLRWIRAKNRMREDGCSYGEFYCNHVFDPTDPWVWVDFTFFHSKLKRYFAVAMVTAEYAAYEQADNRAIDEAYEAIPKDFSVPLFVRDGTHPHYGKLWRFNNTPDDDRRYALTTKLRDQYLELEYKIAPRILIADYGKVAVGVHATVNRAYIDEHSIREFIEHFRSLGEPVKAGWEWEDEEVAVVPRRFKRGKVAE